MATDVVQTVDHDPVADAIYVHLAEGNSESVLYLDDLRLVDVGANGTIGGIEFLHISGGINLTNVPQRETVEQLIAPFDFRILM